MTEAYAFADSDIAGYNKFLMFCSVTGYTKVNDNHAWDLQIEFSLAPLCQYK